MSEKLTSIIISYLIFLHAEIIAWRMTALMITAGLFCPIIVLAMGIAFVHLALEMRKIQLLFNIYVRKAQKKAKAPQEEQRNVAVLPIPEKKQEQEPEPVILRDRPVLNISTQETVDKYRDISLPDNLDLHFVDKP